MRILAVILVWCFATALHSFAYNIPLQNATATFSQNFNGDYNVASAIDGNVNDNRGWAIFPNIGAQTAVFRTATPAGFAGGSLLTFTLNQNYFINPGHTIGRFRLSVTMDDPSTFADGLASGGSVSANWIVLDPASEVSANGTTLTRLGDRSMLASGFAPGTDIYTVTALTSLGNITGVRLEVLPDSSLPSGGPGRAPNLNFVLSEFSLDISPPSPAPTGEVKWVLVAGVGALIATLSLLLGVLLCLALMWWLRKSSKIPTPGK